MSHGGGGGGGHIESFVIVYNVAKRHNVGTLVRSASAFGVSEMILVGKHKDFNAFGSHGSAPFLRFRHFFSLLDARSYLKVISTMLYLSFHLIRSLSGFFIMSSIFKIKIWHPKNSLFLHLFKECFHPYMVNKHTHTHTHTHTYTHSLLSWW